MRLLTIAVCACLMTVGFYRQTRADLSLSCSVLALKCSGSLQVKDIAEAVTLIKNSLLPPKEILVGPFQYGPSECQIDPYKDLVRLCGSSNGLAAVILKGFPDSHDFLLNLTGEVQGQTTVGGNHNIVARPTSGGLVDAGCTVVFHLHPDASNYGINESAMVKNSQFQLKDITGVRLRVDDPC
jgi:hypothetical protein